MIRKIIEPKNIYLSYYNLNKITSILLFNIFNAIGNYICKYEFFVGFNVKRLRT